MASARAQKKRSAGVLALRREGGELQYFLAHPGGPFFRKRDEGAWTIPKGLLEPGDADPLAAARRELTEETGFAAPPGPYVALGHVVQKGGKRVEAWAVVADFDPAALRSNEFELEWPPRSGRRQRFAEVDRAGWFGLAEARVKILEAQRPLLERAREPEVLATLGLG
jgi:predicted NUDIX family NTP pyrophosphohydrolase